MDLDGFRAFHPRKNIMGCLTPESGASPRFSRKNGRKPKPQTWDPILREDDHGTIKRAMHHV